jgi:serine/threonine-protein kinase
LTEPSQAPTDPFTSSLAGRRVGRYEILARLATGGMAGVYVARALGVAGFERLFAIKVLHPHLAHEEEFITMFLDEARLAARIRHPNVVPTIDISDTQDAGYFLVMDYIEGDHLGALLQAAFKRGSRLPAPVSLRIVVDALDGLAAAHDLSDEHGQRINLVHRDVSPHNVMVSTDGIARLTDFGVAKAEVRLSTTQEGQFKGKLAYMAPEHASNGEADQRSDLFSMGIILWECLTGRRLFRAENHAATLNKICIEPIPMPSSVDAALAPFDHVLERALARDPDQRFQTAEEFAEAIEQAADSLGGLASQRAVAKLVRDLAAEKIARDEEMIRSAIAEIGSAPVDGGSIPSGASSSNEPAAGAPPIAAPPPVSAPAPTGLERPGPRRWPMLLLAALALIAIVLAVAALLIRGEPAPVTTTLEREPETASDTPTASDAEDQLAAESGEGAAAGEPTDEPQAPANLEDATGAGDAENDEAATPVDDAQDEAVADGPSETAPREPPRRRRKAAPASRPQRAPRGESKPERKPEQKLDDLLLNPYRQ